MELMLNEIQPSQERNKIKNVLVRYCDLKEARSECLENKNYQHPENVYLAK